MAGLGGEYTLLPQLPALRIKPHSRTRPAHPYAEFMAKARESLRLRLPLPAHIQDPVCTLHKPRLWQRREKPQVVGRRRRGWGGVSNGEGRAGGWLGWEESILCYPNYLRCG